MLTPLRTTKVWFCCCELITTSIKLKFLKINFYSSLIFFQFIDHQLYVVPHRGATWRQVAPRGSMYLKAAPWRRFLKMWRRCCTSRHIKPDYTTKHVATRVATYHHIEVKFQMKLFHSILIIQIL